MKLLENIRLILEEYESNNFEFADYPYEYKRRKVGDDLYFEYHCLETEQSCDAELWHRTHQKVKVIKEYTPEESDVPTYRVKFADGFEGDVEFDELLDSDTEYERLDYVKPKPKQKLNTASPVKTYGEDKYNNRNVFIKGSPTNNVVMFQFSSGKLYDDRTPEIMTQYYNKLYSGVREGYTRPNDFWEIPQWISNVAYMVPDSDVYVIRDISEAEKFINSSQYKMALFSVMDVNKDEVRRLAENNRSNTKIGIGGYSDMSMFHGIKNVQLFTDLKQLSQYLNVPYKKGYNFKHFTGVKCIPRLTLSSGCLHKCTFCVIPKNLSETDKEAIDQQVESFKNLNASLIYIDDKTFGQAGNYFYLVNIFDKMKSNNPDFEGFIIQTTALQMRKLNASWLKAAGIKYIELGIESYNNAILKRYKKPANEQIIDDAVEKIRDAGINFIPNIIVGFPEETYQTYKHTYDFIVRNSDIISHMNIYNLAVYDHTELSNMIKVKFDSDADENVITKSFHSDPNLHKSFFYSIYKLGIKLLDRKPYA